MRRKTFGEFHIDIGYLWGASIFMVVLISLIILAILPNDSSYSRRRAPCGKVQIVFLLLIIMLMTWFFPKGRVPFGEIQTAVLE